MGIFPRKDKEPTNPKLIRAIRAVALNDNYTTRRKLYQELLKSILFVPTPTDMGYDKRTKIYFEKGKEILFFTSKNSEGKTVLPVFTDSKSLRMWKATNCYAIEMQAIDIFQFVFENNFASIIINPASPTGGVISRREIKALAGGFIPTSISPDKSMKMKFKRETQVNIGAPTEKPPQKLIKQIREGIYSHPEIKAGYLFQMIIENEEPHLTVGIRFSGPMKMHIRDKIMMDLVRRIESVIGPDEYIDILPLDTLDLLREVKKHVPPLFQRK